MDAMLIYGLKGQYEMLDQYYMSVRYSVAGGEGTFTCADPESFARGGPNFITFFQLMGIEDPNTAINGPASAHQRNAIEMAFRWWADAGPTLNAGSVA